MMKLRAIRTASFSLFFLLSGFALSNAQAPPPEPTEAPSRLSMFVDDFANWLHHIGTDADRVDHHRASHSPPLGVRARPVEQGMVGIPAVTRLVQEEYAYARSNK